jgi:hypothetical protein
MNRLKFTSIACGLLILACDAPVTAPSRPEPSFSVNNNSGPFRFVDLNTNNDVVGEVSTEVRGLYHMNLVTGNSQGVVSNPSVLWTTSNPQVATVTAAKGRALVRMIAPGYATIRASLGTAQATALFHVFGSAHHFVVSTSNQGPAIGSTITVNAQVVDALNQVLNAGGRTVTWGSTNGGTFTAPTSTTNANGVATVSFKVGTNTSTPHVLSATDDAGLTGASAAVMPQAGAPASVQLELVATQFLTGVTVPVFATVRDAYGNPAPGVSVTWTWTGALTSTGPNPGLTDDDGRVLGAFQTTGTPGTFKVTAKAGAAIGSSPNFSTIILP